MIGSSHAFSGFSVDDIDAARQFYGAVLGLNTGVNPMGMLDLQLAGGGHVVVYPKPNHEPATFTVLNFEVDDIDAAVDELVAAGVSIERYEGANQDDKGIARDPLPHDAARHGVDHDAALPARRPSPPAGASMVDHGAI